MGAEDGCHDDLAMCLVIFAWLVAQDFFKRMTDSDVRNESMKNKRTKLAGIWFPLVLFWMVWMTMTSLLMVMATVDESR